MMVVGNEAVVMPCAPTSAVIDSAAVAILALSKDAVNGMKGILLNKTDAFAKGSTSTDTTTDTDTSTDITTGTKATTLVVGFGKESCRSRSPSPEPEHICDDDSTGRSSPMTRSSPSDGHPSSPGTCLRQDEDIDSHSAVVVAERSPSNQSSPLRSTEADPSSHMEALTHLLEASVGVNPNHHRHLDDDGKGKGNSTGSTKTLSLVDLKASGESMDTALGRSIQGAYESPKSVYADESMDENDIANTVANDEPMINMSRPPSSLWQQATTDDDVTINDANDTDDTTNNDNTSTSATTTTNNGVDNVMTKPFSSTSALIEIAPAEESASQMEQRLLRSQSKIETMLRNARSKLASQQLQSNLWHTNWISVATAARNASMHATSFNYSTATSYPNTTTNNRLLDVPVPVSTHADARSHTHPRSHPHVVSDTLVPAAQILRDQCAPFLRRRKRTTTGRNVRHTARTVERSTSRVLAEIDGEFTDRSSGVSSESEVEAAHHNEHPPLSSRSVSASASASAASSPLSVAATTTRKVKRRKVQHKWDSERAEVGWRWSWLDLKLRSLNQRLEAHDTLYHKVRTAKQPIEFETSPSPLLSPSPRLGIKTTTAITTTTTNTTIANCNTANTTNNNNTANSTTATTVTTAASTPTTTTMMKSKYYPNGSAAFVPTTTTTNNKTNNTVHHHGCARARPLVTNFQNRQLVKGHLASPTNVSHNAFRAVATDPLVQSDPNSIRARSTLLDFSFHLVLSLPADAPESVLGRARVHRRHVRTKANTAHANAIKSLAAHKRAAMISSTSLKHHHVAASSSSSSSSSKPCSTSTVVRVTGLQKKQKQHQLHLQLLQQHLLEQQQPPPQLQPQPQPQPQSQPPQQQQQQQPEQQQQQQQEEEQQQQQQQQPQQQNVGVSGVESSVTISPSATPTSPPTTTPPTTPPLPTTTPPPPTTTTSPPPTPTTTMTKKHADYMEPTVQMVTVVVDTGDAGDIQIPSSSSSSFSFSSSLSSSSLLSSASTLAMGSTVTVSAPSTIGGQGAASGGGGGGGLLARRKKTHHHHDIDDIVIPNILTPSRYEPLPQVKEIVTPTWRTSTPNTPVAVTPTRSRFNNGNNNSSNNNNNNTGNTTNNINSYNDRVAFPNLVTSTPTTATGVCLLTPATSTTTSPLRRHAPNTPLTTITSLATTTPPLSSAAITSSRLKGTHPTTPTPTTPTPTSPPTPAPETLSSDFPSIEEEEVVDVVVRVQEDGNKDEVEEEDISDGLFATLHAACEAKERRRFLGDTTPDGCDAHGNLKKVPRIRMIETRSSSVQPSSPFDPRAFPLADGDDDNGDALAALLQSLAEPPMETMLYSEFKKRQLQKELEQQQHHQQHQQQHHQQHHHHHHQQHQHQQHQQKQACHSHDTDKTQINVDEQKPIRLIFKLGPPPPL